MPACVDSGSFLAAVSEMSELRPFPTSATRLIETSNDPDSSPRDMAVIIRNDPALSVNLLRAANSSMYGFAGEIRTVDHAVVVLGIRSVRNLAVALAATAVFSQGSNAAEARSRLWGHSLGCATLARVMATRTKLVPADEAFLAGIVHDVGKLIFYDLVPEQYLKVTDEATTRTILEREGNEFGATHQEIGLMCAEQWGLPEEINQAICFHHNPADADISPDLVALVGLSNGLAAAWGIGATSPAEDEAEIVRTSDIRISPEDLADIRNVAVGEYKHLATSMT
jgi:putative nucleotidyltransferase with HDIG domain